VKVIVLLLNGGLQSNDKKESYKEVGERDTLYCFIFPPAESVTLADVFFMFMIVLHSSQLSLFHTQTNKKRKQKQTT
jgi:hypothetical protein